MEKIDVKPHIAGTVTFQYYREKALWYKSSSGLIFPVPVSDIGDATFLPEDKAMLFMRYIRKHLESLKTDGQD